MPRKRTGQGRPLKGTSGQPKSRIHTSIIPRTQSAYDLSARSQSTRSSLLNVASDMRRNPNLSFTQACRNRGVDPRSRRNHVTALFYKDASDKVRPRKSDNYPQTMSIPSTRPDVLIHFVARGSKERHLVGEWLTAIKEAGRGNFTRISKFPKGVIIDGVRLPTGAYEVQRILEAMETAEQPFEHLYAMAGAA